MGDFYDKHFGSLVFKKHDSDEAKTAEWDTKLPEIAKALDVFEKYAPESGLLIGPKISMLDIQVGQFFALIYQERELAEGATDSISYAKAETKKLIEARPKTHAWSQAFRGGQLKDYLAARPKTCTC